MRGVNGVPGAVLGFVVGVGLLWPIAREIVPWSLRTWWLFDKDPVYAPADVPRVVVDGVVTDEAGEPVPFAWVTAWGADAPVPTDGEGGFRLELPQGGRLDVISLWTGGATPVSAEDPYAVLTVKGHCARSLRVVTPAGEPVAGAQVYVGGALGPVATTDEAGAWRGAVSCRKATAVVAATGWARQTVPLEEDGVVTLSPGVAGSVRVTSATGLPVAGAAVRIELAGDSREVETEADGVARWRWKELPAEDWAVVVTHPAHRPTSGWAKGSGHAAVVMEPARQVRLVCPGWHGTDCGRSEHVAKVVDRRGEVWSHSIALPLTVNDRNGAVEVSVLGPADAAFDLVTKEGVVEVPVGVVEVRLAATGALRVILDGEFVAVPLDRTLDDPFGFLEVARVVAGRTGVAAEATVVGLRPGRWRVFPGETGMPMSVAVTAAVAGVPLPGSVDVVIHPGERAEVTLW